MAVALRRLGVKELCMVVVEAAAANEEEVATDTARIRMKMASGDECRRRRRL